MEYNYGKKSLWKWILLYVIIGAIAYGAVYYFFFYKKGNGHQVQNYQVPANQSSSQNYPPEQVLASNDTAIWKTYTSSNNYFSIPLPPHWMVKTNGEYGVALSGKEGGISIAWNGLGGACDPEDMGKITISGEVFDVCHYGPMDVGSIGENWSLIYKTLSPTVTVGVIAGANIPASTNRGVVLKVLQSIQFHAIGQVADWKTYKNTNTEYGFEVQYPAAWPEPMETSKGEVNFNNRIFIHYYKTSQDLPDDYYSKNKENIILPGGSYSAIKVQKNYCMVLLTNEIFTQTNFESFNPSKEPIYSIEGPEVCDYKNDPKMLSKNYSEMEKIYNQMVSTFKFFKK